jgi:hypothetical protein
MAVDALAVLLAVLDPMGLLSGALATLGLESVGLALGLGSGAIYLWRGRRIVRALISLVSTLVSNVIVTTLVLAVLVLLGWVALSPNDVITDVLNALGSVPRRDLGSLLDGVLP